MDKPRHVLMTADTIGGVWTYALELVKALQPYGVRFTMATMGGPVSAAQARQAAAIDTLDLCQSNYRLEWMQEPWRDVDAAGEWLLSIAEQRRPDVVHLNNYPHGALPWGAPVLMVGHSCVLSWWRAVHRTQAPGDWDQYRARVRHGLRQAHVVAAPSRPMLLSLEQDYGPFQVTRVILNGRRCETEKAGCKEPFIFSAGRVWDAAKNLHALNQVAPQLRWPVYVAGSAACPSGHEVQAPNVKALGELSSEELLGWMRRASIYALPARYEPFGLSILEAALNGCALVLGEIESLKEIWGEAACFVPPDDPLRLRRELNALASDPGRRLEMSRRAVFAARQFTPEKMAAQYLSAYAQAARRFVFDRSKEAMSV